jgi:hypothetical protein
MNGLDPLKEFERMAARLWWDEPPVVHVAAEVMRRVRAVEATAERTLALFAAGSCVAATAVVVLGFWLLSQVDNPLGAIFQIVPPIGF